MSLRTIVSGSLLVALGFMPTAASAGQFGDLVKGQVQQQVQQQVRKHLPQTQQSAGGQQKQTLKFPNGNTGVVGPKILTAPTKSDVAKPGNQGINPKVGIPIVPGIVVKPGNKAGNGGFNPGVFIPKPVGGGGGKPGGFFPNIPIDPGMGNGNGGNGGGNGNPILENIAQQILNNVLNGGGGGNCNNGGNGGGNGGNGGNNGGGNQGNGGGNGFPGQGGGQLVYIDLQVQGLQLVDLGDETMGPAYRITLRNNSNRSATAPFVALLMASPNPQPATDSPYATLQVPSLAAGQTTAVDVRLPQLVTANASSFGFLTAAVGTPAGMFEQNDADNRGSYARATVAEIPAKVFGVRVDETAGHMILDGEGFGSQFGKLYLTVDGQNYEANVSAWGPTMVYFTIDGYAGQGAAGSFSLVRNDGRLAPPLDVALAN
ncbi:MAG: hypothetical protein QM775_06730 [Pirellulales bacterium]